MNKSIEQMSDRELQRAIAELRGITIQPSSNGYWLITMPDGKVNLISGTNIEEVWDYALYHKLPRWPMSTHVAVVDLLAECEGAKLAWCFGDWEAYFPITATTDKASIAESNHPARAISMAWLAWKRGE